MLFMMHRKKLCMIHDRYNKNRNIGNAWVGSSIVTLHKGTILSLILHAAIKKSNVHSPSSVATPGDNKL